MADEDRSDSGTEDFYDDGEEVYDDEGTLDEEEMLDGGEEYEDELKNLEDDANLSVEELRRRYYGVSGVEEEYRSSDEAQSTSTPDKNTPREGSGEISDLVAMTSSDAEDNEDDIDYSPPDLWRREVREGSGYQAEVPDEPSFVLPHTDHERSNLLWSPVCDLAQEAVDNFLSEFYKLAFESSESASAHDLSRYNGFEDHQFVKDDENALKALMDADYNVEVALSRFPYEKANATNITAPAQPKKWSEQECDLFEEGLRVNGKNFFTIHRTKLPNRTVGEIIHFYYIWKKTERHDVFVERTKFQERPNCTDFMGRIISRMEAATGDTSVSLNESLEFADSTNLEIMGTRPWGDCWQPQADGSPLPHLDNDTLANVLQ